jgi:hypothetical protein
METGSEDGNDNDDSVENGRFVEESPWRVKGKSLRSAVSGGSIAA